MVTAPSATMRMQAQSVQDVLAVQEQMLGYAGQGSREAARKVRAQEEMQRQEREIQEEAEHLQEQQTRHEEVMRKMRERSAAGGRAEGGARGGKSSGGAQGCPVGGEWDTHRGEDRGEEDEGDG